MRRFHEGKACDAVLRRIESREGFLRRDIRFPERELHPAPVELTCMIGDRLFAFEHTGIEPFEQHIELEAKAQAHFQPIQERLRGGLPANEHFVLQVPATATLKLRPREIRQMQDALVEWVRETAPTLPAVRRSSFATPLRYANVAGVPFEVFLIRTVLGGLPGHLSVTHLVERNEGNRISRIRRAYNAKCPKLASWQQTGARTVLVFEENDPQVTNHFLVAEAVKEVELTATQKPDEIYLLSSAIDAFWSLWVLRIGDHVFRDLSIHGDSITAEIDPGTLVSVTGR
jgi:hypothetical protein